MCVVQCVHEHACMYVFLWNTRRDYIFYYFKFRDPQRTIFGLALFASPIPTLMDGWMGQGCSLRSEGCFMKYESSITRIKQALSY